jgi:hypothetical protein
MAGQVGAEDVAGWRRWPAPRRWVETALVDEEENNSL